MAGPMLMEPPALGAKGSSASSQMQRKWAEKLAPYLQQYAQGGLVGGMVGSLAGRDPESSSTYGGLLGTVGFAIGGPVGGLIGGFLGGLFGKKKKKEPPKQEDPQRDIYGMPAFEWESYLYNLYKSQEGLTSKNTGSLSNTRMADVPSGLIADLVRPLVSPTVSDNRSITINVSGGDLTKVKQVVNEALRSNFGPMAKATVLASRGT